MPGSVSRMASCFVFSSCDFVDRSVCPEKQGRSTKSHEPTRNSLLTKSTFEAKTFFMQQDYRSTRFHDSATACDRNLRNLRMFFGCRMGSTHISTPQADLSSSLVAPV